MRTAVYNLMTSFKRTLFYMPSILLFLFKTIKNENAGK